MKENHISKQLERKKRRGVVGIESAIVLISFVIVAAALAFVVLNMGFSTTQKAKETIGNTLDEAGVALAVEGTITASGSTSSANVTDVSIPLRVTAGSSSVNVQNATMTVSYFGLGTNNVALSNIYKGPLDGTFGTLSAAQSSIGSTCDGTTTCAYIYWTKRVNDSAGTNDVIDPGEHAVLVINLQGSHQAKFLDEVKVDLNTPNGSVLTVTRGIPEVTTTVLDLT